MQRIRGSVRVTQPPAQRRPPAHPVRVPDDLVMVALSVIEQGRPYETRTGDLGCRWGQAHVCLTRLGHLYVLLPNGIHTLWDSAPGTPQPVRRLALTLIRVSLAQ